MRFGFILTTGNGTPLPERALACLPACLRPGDEVIVVDAGSADGTAERVEEAMDLLDFGPGIAVHPVLLGGAPPGWRPVAANVGLRAATADAVVLLEDGAWLDDGAFARARQAFEAADADLLIARTEADDSLLWQALPAPTDRGAVLRRAITMPADTARMIFRRDLLPPDGRGVPETGPEATNCFLWRILTAAERPMLLDAPLGHSPNDRAGSDDPDAGLSRYEEILTGLPKQAGDFQALALTWLMARMAGDIPRLSPPARLAFAGRGARLFAACPAPVWNEAMADPATDAFRPVAEALRRGEVIPVTRLWMEEESLRILSDLSARMSEVEDRLDRLATESQVTGRRVESLCRIAEFAALAQLDMAEDAPGS